MVRRYFVTLVIFLNAIRYCDSVLNDAKQNVIESLNEQLNIKHICIVKDDNFLIDQEILRFAKKLFNGNIFTSFMSVSEMNVSMVEYYKTPMHYYYPQYREQRVMLEKIRDEWVYPPKTIVMPYGEKVKSLIRKFFTVKYQLVVSKYIWLVFENDDDELFSNSEENYIPFNCQFLIVKNFMDEQGDYGIEEIYHPSRESRELFVRHFGNWNEANGLVTWEPDFYKRRLDMNGTVLICTYKKEFESFMAFNARLAQIISRIMNIRWKPLYLTEDKDYENRALSFNLKTLSTIFYVPDYIGPFWKETFHFYLAYDKTYEQYGIAPLSKPFSFNLWMAVLGWLIIATISITIILKQINKRLKSGLNSPVLMSDCLYEPFDSILNQGGGKLPAKSSLNIVSISSRIVALVLAPLYTGAIASFILIPAITLPFTTPKEFVQDGSYKAGTIALTKLDHYVSLSNDQWMQEITRNYLVLINGSLINDAIYESVKSVCDDHKFVLLSASTINWENKNECKIIKIRSPVLLTWAVMYLNYESPYRAIFNMIVHSIRSTGNFKGVFEMFSKEGAGDFTMFEASSSNNNYDDDKIQLTNLVPVFTLISVSYAFSITILFAEIILFKRLK